MVILIEWKKKNKRTIIPTSSVALNGAAIWAVTFAIPHQHRPRRHHESPEPLARGLG